MRHRSLPASGCRTSLRFLSRGPGRFASTWDTDHDDDMSTLIGRSVRPLVVWSPGVCVTGVGRGGTIEHRDGPRRNSDGRWSDVAVLQCAGVLVPCDGRYLYLGRAAQL